MPVKKPTAAQRSALEKLAKGHRLTYSTGGRVSGPPIAWFPEYYDKTAYERLGKRYGDKYVNLLTLEALKRNAWVASESRKSGFEDFTITDAGRAALETR